MSYGLVPFYLPVNMVFEVTFIAIMLVKQYYDGLFCSLKEDKKYNGHADLKYAENVNEAFIACVKGFEYNMNERLSKWGKKVNRKTDDFILSNLFLETINTCEEHYQKLCELAERIEYIILLMTTPKEQIDGYDEIKINTHMMLNPGDYRNYGMSFVFLRKLLSLGNDKITVKCKVITGPSLMNQTEVLLKQKFQNIYGISDKEKEHKPNIRTVDEILEKVIKPAVDSDEVLNSKFDEKKHNIEHQVKMADVKKELLLTKEEVKSNVVVEGKKKSKRSRRMG